MGDSYERDKEQADRVRYRRETPWPLRAWRWTLARAGYIILGGIVLQILIAVAREYL